jgi:hypothetical protein
VLSTRALLLLETLYSSTTHQGAMQHAHQRSESAVVEDNANARSTFDLPSGKKTHVICTAPDGPYDVHVNLKPVAPVNTSPDEPRCIRRLLHTSPYAHHYMMTVGAHRVFEEDVLELLWARGGLSRAIDIHVSHYNVVPVAAPQTETPSPSNDAASSAAGPPEVKTPVPESEAAPQTTQLQMKADFCRVAAKGRSMRWPFSWNGQPCFLQPLGTYMAFDIVTEDSAVADATLQDFMTTLHDLYQKRIPPPAPNKVCIYSSRIDLYGRGSWIERQNKPGRAMSTIYLPEAQVRRARQTLSDFLKPETAELYERCGRDYKLVMAFTGPPGLGKTSFCMALCTELEMNVAVLNVTPALTDSIFESLIDNMPCGNGRVTMLLMEDIDCLFAPGVSSGESKTISPSKLLNTLNGAASKHQLVVGMTSNNDITQFEERFRRASRLDLHIEFTNPGQQQCLQALQGLGPMWAHEHKAFLDRSARELKYPFTIADLSGYVFPLLQRHAKSMMDDFDTEWRPLVERSHAPMSSSTVSGTATDKTDKDTKEKEVSETKTDAVPSSASSALPSLYPVRGRGSFWRGRARVYG